MFYSFNFVAELDIFVAGNTEREAYNDWFDMAQDNEPLSGDLTVAGVNLFRISNSSLLLLYENGTSPSDEKDYFQQLQLLAQ